MHRKHLPGTFAVFGCGPTTWANGHHRFGFGWASRAHLASCRWGALGTPADASAPRFASHPFVRLDGMTDDDDLPDANELEQLAQSLAMDGSLTRTDARTVAAVLRWGAARRRHPSGRS
jgi:hypothetical protein